MRAQAEFKKFGIFDSIVCDAVIKLGYFGFKTPYPLLREFWLHFTD